MKKFLGIIVCLMCVMFVFAGCESKESEDKYYTDVYDVWHERQMAETNSEFFTEDGQVSYNSESINSWIVSQEDNDFKNLKTRYNAALNALNHDITKLSYMFIHDPKLTGKELRQAKKNVKEYKTAVEDYDSAISSFCTAREKLIVRCNDAVMSQNRYLIGEIENNALKEFEQSYTNAITACSKVYSKMFACAETMYLGEPSAQEIKDNNQRKAVAKYYYYKVRQVELCDGIWYCFSQNGSYDKQTEKEWQQFIFVTTTKNFKLSEENFDKTLSAQQAEGVDGCIKSLQLNLEYYRAERSMLQDIIDEDLFTRDLSGEDSSTYESAKKIEGKKLYDNLFKVTVEQMGETFMRLVAFYN